VGTFGDVRYFFFLSGKNLGAMGDAGAITTSTAIWRNRMAMFAGTVAEKGRSSD